MGIVALGYRGFALLDAEFQTYQTWRLERALKASKSSAGESEQLHPPLLPSAGQDGARAESHLMAVPPGSPLGRIEISKLGLAAIIAEATDEGTLRHAVGHLLGTPLPGEQGNVVSRGTGTRFSDRCETSIRTMRSR